MFWLRRRLIRERTRRNWFSWVLSNTEASEPIPWLDVSLNSRLRLSNKSESFQSKDSTTTLRSPSFFLPRIKKADMPHQPSLIPEIPAFQFNKENLVVSEGISETPQWIWSSVSAEPQFKNRLHIKNKPEVFFATPIRDEAKKERFTSELRRYRTYFALSRANSIFLLPPLVTTVVFCWVTALDAVN